MNPNHAFAWQDFYDEANTKSTEGILIELIARQREQYGNSFNEPCMEAQELLDQWKKDTGEDYLQLWRGLVALSTPDAKPKAVKELPTLQDADLHGESTPAMEALLDKKAVFMAGSLYDQGDRRNTKDGDWKRCEFTWYEWLAMEKIGLCNHPVAKTKQGPSLVFAEALGGARKDSAIKTMYSVGLDIDSGAALDDVIQKLIDLELFAIVYTSFSHGKSVLELKHDDIVRKLKLNDTPNRAQVQAYLREHHKDRYDPEFIDSIKIVDSRKLTKDGMRVVVETPALDKFRVILPLAEPVELKDLGATLAQYKEAWENAVAGVAVNMLEVNFDASSCDINRLFYTPRHPSESEDWYACVVQGDPLKFEDIKAYSKNAYVKNRDDNDPFAKGTETGKDEIETFMTPTDRNLNRWHKDHKERFLITDVIETFCDDKIVKAGNERVGTVHVQCPFEHEHSSTGGTATMCKNPLENDNGYWTIFCRHDACTGRPKLHFLQEMIEQEWFDEDVLVGEDFNLGAADEDMEPEPVTTSDLNAAMEKNGLSKESTEAQILAFMRGYADADAGVKSRITEKLGTNSRQKGLTALTPSDLNKLWKKIVADALQRKIDGEADKRATYKTPDYIPLAEATSTTVIEAAKVSKWLPQGYAYSDGWLGKWREDTGDPKFFPIVRAFETVYFADGASGSSRTNQLTIRYPHRSKSLGVVESTFRIGDTYKDSGTILSKLRNEGLDFHPKAATEDILTLLRACSSDREAVYYEQSGWNADRSVYVSPTGISVSRADDPRIHVLENTMRVSDARTGDLETWTNNASTIVKGKNGSRMLPGLLMGFAGCTADFIDADLAPVLANEGKAGHGKSSSLMCGVSAYALPTEAGLLLSGDVTPTAQEAMAVKSNGAAYALDELGASKMNEEDEQRMIFQHAGKIGRGRGTTDGGMRDVRGWNCTLGLSTERGLLGRLEAADVDVKSGSVSRVFTVSFDSAVTLRRSPSLDSRSPDYNPSDYDDAELDAIATLAKGEACGWAGPVFAEKLLEYGEQVVKERVSALTEEWREGRGGASGRVVFLVALFAVSAQIAQEAGLLPKDADLKSTLKGLLEETLAQRAHHLDTKRQAKDALRLNIIRAVNAGTIRPLGSEPEGFRETLGYYKSGDTKFGAESDKELFARTYFLPKDRLSNLGVKTELGALVTDLREECALVEPNGEPSGVWRNTPGEGRVPCIRVTGQWVHG